MDVRANKFIQPKSAQTNQASSQQKTSPNGNKPIFPQTTKDSVYSMNRSLFDIGQSSNITKNTMQKTLPDMTTENRVQFTPPKAKNSTTIVMSRDVNVPAQRKGKPAAPKHFVSGYGSGTQGRIDREQDAARARRAQISPAYVQSGGYNKGFNLTDLLAAGAMTIGAGKGLFGASSGAGKADGADGAGNAGNANGAQAKKSSSSLGSEVKSKTDGIKASCNTLKGISFAGLGNISSADTNAMNAAKDVDVQPKVDLTDIVNSFEKIKGTDISNILPAEIKPPDFVTDAQLSSLETVSTSISDLSTSIETADGKLSSTIMKLTSRLTQPNYDAKEVQAQIDKLTAAQKALGKMKTEISKINGQLDAENGPAKALPKQVKEAKTLYQEQVKAQEKENKDLNDANKEVQGLLKDLSDTKTDKKQNKKIAQLKTALTRLEAANTVVTNRENAITTDDVKINPDTTVAKTISDAKMVLNAQATEDK